MTDLATESVDWSKLHHAYGRATDVPEQLRALSSPSPQARGRAHSDLRSNVYHQGTRWQASAATVPHLAALADDPATPDRAQVIELLRLVAVGDLGDGDLPFDPAELFGDVDDTLADEDFDPETDEYDDHWLTLWARDAYEAAAAAGERMVAWLADPDPAVVAAAADLVVWFGEAGRRAVPGLVAVGDADENSSVEIRVARVAANLALAHVDPGALAGVVRARLVGLLGDGDFAVGVSAAVALAFQEPVLGVVDGVGEVLASVGRREEELREVADASRWDRSLVLIAERARVVRERRR